MKKNISKTIMNSDRILLLAVVCSTLAIFWVGIQTNISLKELLEQSRKSKILADCLNNIHHLDELLTNSAQLAANTGEQKWVDGYHFYEPKLDEAIKKAIRIEPSEEAQDKLLMVDSANITLVAIEHRALDLVQSGNTQEAKQLLSGDAYEKAKDKYANGLARFIKILDQKNFQRYTLIDRRTNLYYYILFVAVVFSLIVGVLLLKLRRNTRKELIKNNRLLQEEVQKRLQNEATLMMFEQTFKSVNDVINVADLNDNILFVNPAFCKTYGYTEEELIGKDSSIFWSERNPKAVVEQILPATLHGGWKGELFNKRKDGTEFPIYLSTSVVKNDSGEQIAIVGIVEDITERKRADLERQVMYEITHGVTTTNNLNELLELIHQSLGKVIYAENIFVALHDQDTKLFSFPYWVDKFDPTPEPVAMGKSCTNYVFRTGRPLLLTQKLFDQLVDIGEVELVGSNCPSWIGVPLKMPSKTIGVLVLQHYEEKNIYSEQDVHFLDSIGTQIASVIERKLAEDALRESELRFRMVWDKATDGMRIVNEEGIVLMANDAYCKMMGKKREEIEGNSLSSVYKPSEYSEIERKHRERFKSRSIAPKLSRDIILWNGETISLDLSNTFLETPGQQPLSLSVLRDVTVQKRAEEALRESEVKLNVILQSTADGILAIDSDGKVIKTNERFAQLWNIPPSIIDSGDNNTLLGFVLEQLIDPEEFLSKVKELYNSTAEDLDNLHFKDGRTFERYSAPLIMSKTSIGRVWSFRDITEKKQAEEKIIKQNEQLKELNETKDKFFSIIAHDLRSPFQGFLNMTALMSENTDEFTTEELAMYLSKLSKSTKNLYALLQNLLEWAQIQNGTIDFLPNEFIINKYVETTIEQISESAKRKGITIINEVAEGQKVFGDERMINSIISNLLTNAVKFTKKDARVTIKSKTVDAEMVEISIEDTGIGMSESTIHKLFKVGEKTGRKGTDGEPSSGLGLLLCKEFVEKQGGKIWVESEEGKGSTFRFTVPYKDPQQN